MRSPLAPLMTVLEGAKELEQIATVSTGLEHLRGTVFFGPDDHSLIASGANGGGVQVFELADGAGERAYGSSRMWRWTVMSRA